MANSVSHLNIDLRSGLLQTLGAQRLTTVLVEELGQSRSVLVLLPECVEPSRLWTFLRGRLREQMGVRRVSLADLEKAKFRDRSSTKCVSVVETAILAETVGARWKNHDAPRTLQNLLECEGLPEVIGFDGWEQLSADAVGRWLEFMSAWAREAQRTLHYSSTRPDERLRRTSAICALVPAALVLEQLPQSNVRLGIHWWWSIPSNLELRLLCRTQDSNELDGDEPHATAETAWREHLLPALAGCDLGLAGALWDVVCEGEEAINRTLHEWAYSRGWSPDRLQSWGANDLLLGSPSQNGIGVRPPLIWGTLWAHGAMHRTHEHGLELNTAALQVLGHHEAVRHRIWRGQAALLMPLIDSVRMRLCRHMTKVYKRGWAIRWELPKEDRELVAIQESDYGCELGFLYHLLYTHSKDELKAQREWVPLIRLARDIRNDLAHYKSISFGEFKAFWREVSQTDGIF